MAKIKKKWPSFVGDTVHCTLIHNLSVTFLSLPLFLYYQICIFIWKYFLHYGRTLSERPCYILRMFFFIFFYGRLSWPNGWTDLHETFTRGRYYVLFANVLDQFIPGPPEITRWAKKWRNFAYFLTPPVPFQISRPNAAKYRDSKKTGSPWKVALHLCQFRRTLAYKPLRSRRRFTIF